MSFELPLKRVMTVRSLDALAAQTRPKLTETVAQYFMESSSFFFMIAWHRKESQAPLRGNSLEAEMRNLVVVLYGAVAAANAQVPFVNLDWEANDGGAWTRSSLVTSQSTVHLRLVATWGAGPDAVCFAGVSFDGVISNALSGDVATNLVRPSPFDFVGNPISAQRQGSLIKIDSTTDTAAPGLGTGWVIADQPSPSMGGVDTSPIVSIFACDLQLNGDGTRSINMIAQTNPRGGPENAAIYRQLDTIFVVATIHGVNVTHVPSSPTAAIMLSCVAVLRRRR